MLSKKLRILVAYPTERIFSETEVPTANNHQTHKHAPGAHEG